MTTPEKVPNNLPSNSKEPKKKVEKVANTIGAREKPTQKKVVDKVIEGKVVQRKKTRSQKFAETFLGTNLRTARIWVTEEVLVPALKNMIADSVSQGVENLVFGEARSRSRTGRRPGDRRHENFSRYSHPESRARHDYRDRPKRRAAHDFSDIIIETRAETEEVLDKMFDLCMRYESVSVADLYDLVGLNSEYTDQNWGWTDLRGSDIRRVRDGYLLDLPRPEPLD